MEIINPTPIQFAAVPSRVRFPRHTLTLIAKATFVLENGSVARFAEEPLPLDDDVVEETEAGPTVVYESDFAPFKPCADLLASARAHLPAGALASQCVAAFQVGPQRVELLATGPRRWQGPLGRIASTPAHFDPVRLCWENAYGGPKWKANPVGRGRRAVEDESGRRYRPLASVEDPDRPVRRRGQRPEPIALSPVPRTARLRASKLGTYRRKWQRTREPWFPEDFDWGYFNAAAEPLKWPGYLHGDEEIVLENLHPEHADYECRLPGLRVRCFLNCDESGVARHQEVAMQLDTLWVDPEAERLVLVWRGVAEVGSQDHEEVLQAQLAAEPLESEPRPREEYEAALAPAPPPEAAPDESVAPEEQEGPSEEDLLAEAEVIEQAAKMREQLAAQGAPAALLAVFDDPIPDPDRLLDTLLELQPIDEEAVAKANQLAQQQLVEVLEAQGEDASLVAEMFDPPEDLADPGLTREDVLERAAAGSSFADADLSELELNGVDLSSLDFAGANLAGTQLAGANLAGANLSRARLSGADLSAADLTGATIEQSDLDSAQLVGANLTGASAVGSIFRGAALTEAVLAEADLTRASLVGVDMSGVRAGAANFTSANFDGSTLDGATFEGAVFEDASLAGVHAHVCNFARANLTRLRAADAADFDRCTFRQAQAIESQWTTSKATVCDFSYAMLTRSNFSEAMLDGSDFSCAEVSNANYHRASLVDTLFESANLFQSRLTRTVVESADFHLANLYAADLRDADVRGASFSEANTKLAVFDSAAAERTR